MWRRDSIDEADGSNELADNGEASGFDPDPEYRH
jgi:hypothetical protein